MPSEMHGVWASGGDSAQWVQLCEVEDKYVALSYNRSVTPKLTSAEARYLAGKLYRMARRIEKGLS